MKFTCPSCAVTIGKHQEQRIEGSHRENGHEIHHSFLYRFECKAFKGCRHAFMVIIDVTSQPQEVQAPRISYDWNRWSLTPRKSKSKLLTTRTTASEYTQKIKQNTAHNWQYVLYGNKPSRRAYGAPTQTKDCATKAQ